MLFKRSPARYLAESGIPVGYRQMQRPGQVRIKCLARYEAFQLILYSLLGLHPI